MTIREVESRCGMDRASIRFYEREGLLAAPRLSNGYVLIIGHKHLILVPVNIEGIVGLSSSVSSS